MVIPAYAQEASETASSASSSAAVMSSASSSKSAAAKGLSIRTGVSRGGLQIALNMARYLTRLYKELKIAPGKIVGADVFITWDEQRYICSIQRALPTTITASMLQSIAKALTPHMSRSQEWILTQLKDPSLCTVIGSRLQTDTKKPVKEVAPKTFLVAKDGMPYSRINPTWNKCIRGTATLEDIRKNPDRQNNLGRGCAYYHTNTSWYHPDLAMYFMYSRRATSGNMYLEVPEGYTVVTDETIEVK